jgi:hypothetical protein
MWYAGKRITKEVLREASYSVVVVRMWLYRHETVQYDGYVYTVASK